MDDRPPTVRQVYAVAAALCVRDGETFPETRDEASELIERLRLETGHPAPRLEDTRVRPWPRPRTGQRWRRARRGRVVGERDDERRASDVAAELVREMR